MANRRRRYSIPRVFWSSWPLLPRFATNLFRVMCFAGPTTRRRPRGRYLEVRACTRVHDKNSGDISRCASCDRAESKVGLRRDMSRRQEPYQDEWPDSGCGVDELQFEGAGPIIPRTPAIRQLRARRKMLAR